MSTPDPSREILNSQRDDYPMGVDRTISVYKLVEMSNCDTMPNGSNKEMAPPPRLQYQVPDEQEQSFAAAMEKYGFRTNADFIAMCVTAVIRASERGRDLRLPLQFICAPDDPNEDAPE